MKKQIYIIQHNTDKSKRYVGATSKSLSEHFSNVWSERYKEKSRPLALAMRSTWRSDWSISQLHDFSEDWASLEKKYVKDRNTFKKGLNCSKDGSGNIMTAKHRLSISKAILCSNGTLYMNAREASLLTGVPRSSIRRCCQGIYKQAGGFTWQFVK